MTDKFNFKVCFLSFGLFILPVFACFFTLEVFLVYGWIASCIIFVLCSIAWLWALLSFVNYCGIKCLREDNGKGVIDKA